MPQPTQHGGLVSHLAPIVQDADPEESGVRLGGDAVHDIAK
jgi:hypothetical protein